jgi:hypothetical protein
MIPPIAHKATSRQSSTNVVGNKPIPASIRLRHRTFGLDRPSTFTGKVAGFGVQESIALLGSDRSCFMIFEPLLD